MTSNRVVARVLVFCMLSAPAWADHVPSRRAAAKADQAKVATRMVELGTTAEAAKDEVARMTAGDVSYFARNVDRVQVVGAAQDLFSGESDNLWYETLGGLGFIGVGALLLLIMSSNSG